MGFRSYLRMRRSLSKYYTPEQYHQQQGHSTHFLITFLIKQVGVVTYMQLVIQNKFKLALSVVEKHYVNNSGFHR